MSSKIVTQMAANALEQGEIGEQLGDLQLPGPCYWIASRSEKIVALKAQLRIPTLAVDKLCNPDSQYSSTKHPRPSCLCQRNRQRPQTTWPLCTLLFQPLLLAITTWPRCCSLKAPNTFFSQGLCTFCLLYLEVFPQSSLTSKRALPQVPDMK